MPCVSIISPCLNGMPHVQQMLASVQQQSMPDWQLLYIDDGSTDGSLEFMQAASRADSRIQVLQTNGRCGAATARNIGLATATGTYVAFLDCDDWWHPDKLRRQLAAMKSHAAAFACSAYQVCGSDGCRIRTQDASLTPTRSRHLRKTLVIGCLTAIFERKHFGHLRFNAGLPSAEDYLFWSDLLFLAESQGLTTVAINLPLAYYRAHEGGKSSNKRHHAHAHWKIFRGALNLPLVLALPLFFSYAANGVKNRMFGRLREDLPTLVDTALAPTNNIKPYAAPRLLFQTFLWALRRVSPLARRAANSVRDVRVLLPAGFAYDPDDHIGSKLAESGLYEYAELQTVTWLAERFSWSDGIMVDVGAHIGVHSCALAKSFAKVVAFEPNPRNFLLLRHNCFGLANVDPHPVALSSSGSRAVLQVATNNSGQGRIVDSSAPCDGIEIQCKTLDELSEAFDLPVRFIKMDVEGHEPAVMQGARETIAAHRPVIGFELLSEEHRRVTKWWQDWLDSNRYELFELRHTDATSSRITTALMRSFMRPQLQLRMRRDVPPTTQRMLFALPTELTQIS